MAKEILYSINNSIPDNIKNDFKRRFATCPVNFIQFSNNLKQIAYNNYDIRTELFKNNDDALYFAGDILAKTFYNFWIKGGDLEAHFIDSAQQTSYHAGFKCLWS
jgi:hypothetical protein